MVGTILAINRTTLSVIDMAVAWKTAVLALSYAAIKLFKTNVAIGPGTILSSLSECDYTGYAPSEVTALNGPALDTAGRAYLTTPEAYFQCDGGGVGNQVYSAGLVGTAPGGTDALATVTIAGTGLDVVTITNPGAGYLLPPHIVVAGDGDGALVHAEIAGGEVTAIVIDDPGTGYTAATFAIEPPVDLLGGSLLESPVPMSLSTDALPIALQQNIPSGL